MRPPGGWFQQPVQQSAGAVLYGGRIAKETVLECAVTCRTIVCFCIRGRVSLRVFKMWIEFQWFKPNM